MPHRVFMIGWEYPPHHSGGLGVACHGITSALSAQQNQIYFTLPHKLVSGVDHMKIVSCIDPSWEKDTKDPYLAPFSSYAQEKHQTFSKIELDRNELSALPQSELERKVQQYAHKVVEQGVSHSKNTDIIHAHDWMSFPAGIQLSKKTGKPLVAHVHSTEFDRIPNGNGSHYISDTEFRGVTYAHRVIAVSNYTKRLLRDKYHVPEDKIDVIYNGIDPLVAKPDVGKHHFAQKRPIVTFMGRLTMQKGVEHFLALAHRVTRLMPNVLFVVAGHGDMYQHLLLQSAYKQLSASLLFTGFVRDNQRETLLDRSDVFVMPSLSEPFGLVALEAAQRHTPVIVSKNSGAAEVLPHALTADYWDINEMVKQITTLLKDKHFAESVIAGQLQDIEKLDWKQSAQDLEKVYAQL